MDFIKEADIVVVGGGVVGCAILRELSKYNVNVFCLKKSRILPAVQPKQQCYSACRF